MTVSGVGFSAVIAWLGVPTHDGHVLTPPPMDAGVWTADLPLPVYGLPERGPLKVGDVFAVKIDGDGGLRVRGAFLPSSTGLKYAAAADLGFVRVTVHLDRLPEPERDWDRGLRTYRRWRLAAVSVVRESSWELPGVKVDFPAVRDIAGWTGKS